MSESPRFQGDRSSQLNPWVTLLGGVIVGGAFYILIIGIVVWL